MGQQLSGVLDAGDICLHTVSQFALVKQMINELFQKWTGIPVLRQGGKRDLSFYSSNLFRCSAPVLPSITL